MIKSTVKLLNRIATRVGKGFVSEMKLDCNVRATLYDGEGKVKQVVDVHNTVPVVGLKAIMDQLLASPTEAKPDWMEVGTGTPGQIKLGAYIVGSRTALSAKTRTDEVVTMTCVFGPTYGTGAITEAGIFNVVTQDAGTMYASASFGVITKNAADTLEIVWTMTAASA
jgi:hypothetical protein